MMRKLIVIFFGIVILGSANSYRQSYVIDFDDFGPVFPDANKMLDKLCRDNFLATDIKNKSDYYEIKTDVPGIEKKDIKITVKENLLSIKIVLSNKEKSDNEYILKERMSKGELSRSFKLRDLDVDGDIKVKLEKGVLKIDAPKSTKKTAREIKIN
ncbi:MAG: Hsp20 family protein [Legionellales bacterium]|nr:Hsp20 family protein [Legionellales bacterium]